MKQSKIVRSAFKKRRLKPSEVPLSDKTWKRLTQSDLPMTQFVTAILYFKEYIHWNTDAVIQAVSRQLPWGHDTAFYSAGELDPRWARSKFKKWARAQFSTVIKGGKTSELWSSMNLGVFVDIGQFFHAEVISADKVITVAKFERFLKKHPLPWVEAA